MVVRMKITLEQDDFSELVALAFSELRTPESELLYILRKELSLHNQVVTQSDIVNSRDFTSCDEVPNGK